MYRSTDDEPITFEKACNEAARLLAAAEFAHEGAPKSALLRQADSWMDLASLIRFGARYRYDVGVPSKQVHEHEEERLHP